MANYLSSQKNVHIAINNVKRIFFPFGHWYKHILKRENIFNPRQSLHFPKRSPSTIQKGSCRTKQSNPEQMLCKEDIACPIGSLAEYLLVWELLCSQSLPAGAVSGYAAH